MSRVEEALRRATAQAKGDVAAAEDAGSVSPDAVPEFTALGVPFPIETPDRQPIPKPPVPAVPVLTAAPLAPAVRPGAALLEHVDARFAEKVIVDADTLPASREQYRRLAAVLLDAQAETGIKIVMIASAVAGEGKTLTAANLAMTFSESYRKRVLLIDADLRRPTLHQLFRIAASSGLSEGLTAPGEAKLLVRQVSAGLAVLPAGRPNPDPMEGLTSERMRRLIAEAKDAFDWVIIDTPPLVLLPDAHLLASIADGVVLVVRAESTPHAMVKRAVEAIGSNRLLGVVLNAVTTGPYAGYDDYGDNYQYGYSRTSEAV